MPAKRELQRTARRKGEDMDDETATTIVTQWLATDPANAKRLRVSYETQGVAGLRSEAGAYIITTVGVSGIAGTLLRWGIAHDPQPSSRGNVLEWACQQVDWENVGRGLSAIP